MSESHLSEIVKFINSQNPTLSKEKLALIVAERFKLAKNRSVYFNSNFALRFSTSSSESFSNTVLSLSTLSRYDHVPFIVVLVMPTKVKLLLANSTFINKVSHSSHSLTVKNIKGSFNGSDILREFNGYENDYRNFDHLYQVHLGIGFETNLERIVYNTNNIAPIGHRFIPDSDQLRMILNAPARARKFVKSPQYSELESILKAKLELHKQEIANSIHLNNVNLRGRIVEYLITGEDSQILLKIANGIVDNEVNLPVVKTGNKLGDYFTKLNNFVIATDIKSKLMELSSNPKAYNLDKLLEFLSQEGTVLMFFFVGISNTGHVQSTLQSMFQEELLDSTTFIKHWSGRNSRGVAQFDGNVIHGLFKKSAQKIDVRASELFLERMLNTGS